MVYSRWKSETDLLAFNMPCVVLLCCGTLFTAYPTGQSGQKKPSHVYQL